MRGARSKWTESSQQYYVLDSNLQDELSDDLEGEARHFIVLTIVWSDYSD